ncbi:MAG: ArnT family glycosyltransferase, partial [bacterium]
TGQFRLYHHNPPLVKVVAAIAAQPYLKHDLQAKLYQARYWTDEPPNKAGFGHDFAQLYAPVYFELFTAARSVMPVFLVLGGLVVWFWSRSIHGETGGLISLALWVTCPNLMAHGRLITTDVASAAIGTLATYIFVQYLRKSNSRLALFAGIGLGVSLLTKFSLILLVFLWPVIWLLHLMLVVGKPERWIAVKTALKHALVVMFSSMMVVNIGYLFEGTGKSLGSFEFYSRTLTRELPANRTRLHQSGNQLLDILGSHRVNRFRGTILGHLPCPLPAEFMTGFDDQKIDAEGIPKKYLNPNDPTVKEGEVEGYPVYLNGQIRGTGWWYYYPYAFLVKTPPTTLVILATSFVCLIFTKRNRQAWSEESATLVVPLFMIIGMTLLTDINIGLRYILPALPYLYIGCGRIVPALQGRSPKYNNAIAFVLLALLAGSGLSTARVSPHFLAYFNVLAGGPEHADEHLIDSNLDWGQDLVGLKQWLDTNAPGQPVGIAYFGQINPDIYRLRGQGLGWFLPPARSGKVVPQPPGRSAEPLRPGVYAISASLAHGLPWRVYDSSRWAPYDGKESAFDYFLKTKPVAKIGWSIFIYKIDEPTAAMLEAERTK